MGWPNCCPTLGVPCSDGDGVGETDIGMGVWSYPGQVQLKRNMRRERDTSWSTWSVCGGGEGGREGGIIL